jgi:hypothetical protein
MPARYHLDMFDRRFGLCLALFACSCGSSSPSSSTGSTGSVGFTAEEMQASIRGAWTGTFLDAPGTLTIALDYVPPAKTTACGTHIASHPLCIDLTQSSVKATIQSTDTRFDGKTGTGHFSAAGKPTNGDLDLDLGGGLTVWGNGVDGHLEGSFSLNGAPIVGYTVQRAP